MIIKIKPILIFITILSFFMISIVITHNSSREGYLTYNKTVPVFNRVVVSQYSKDKYLYKIYDSIYFDPNNGNVIQLFGLPYKPNKKISDTNGYSLTDLILFKRPTEENESKSNSSNVIRQQKHNGSFSIIPKEHIKSSIQLSNEYKIYPKNTNFDIFEGITFSYQVLYISVGKSTILHVYNCTNTSNIHIGTYLLTDSHPISSMYKGGLPTNLGSFVVDNDPKNNQYVDEPLYDPVKNGKVFQLSHNVLFDTTNRNLLVRNKKTLTVYDGTLDTNGKPKQNFTNINKKGVIKYTTKFFNEKLFRKFNVLYIKDTEYNSCVLYMPLPSSKKTVVAIISMDPKILGLITVRNVVIFNPDSANGIDEIGRAHV